MITGIIVSLPEELATLTRKKIATGSCTNLSAHVMVACAGVGIDNARSAARLLIDKGCGRLVSWGCAAALDTSLQPGDLVVPEVLIAENLEQYFADNGWHRQIIARLAAAGELSSAPICESSHLVATSLEKRTLRETHGCSAVDMESVAIARTALRYGIPFLAIRCIADPADMNLPNAIAHALDDQGRVKLLRLLSFIVRHPREIPGLIKLGRHFHAATDKLQYIARDLEQTLAYTVDQTQIYQQP